MSRILHRVCIVNESKKGVISREKSIALHQIKEISFDQAILMAEHKKRGGTIWALHLFRSGSKFSDNQQDQDVSENLEKSVKFKINKQKNTIIFEPEKI